MFGFRRFSWMLNLIHNTGTNLARIQKRNSWHVLGRGLLPKVQNKQYEQIRNYKTLMKNFRGMCPWLWSNLGEFPTANNSATNCLTAYPPVQISSSKQIFKYISFNKTMTQLSSTLSKCAKDLAGFAVMFIIFFLAFAQLGYLLFGGQDQNYASLGTCVWVSYVDKSVISVLQLYLQLYTNRPQNWIS